MICVDAKLPLNLLFKKNPSPAGGNRRKDLGELHAGPAGCLTADAADRSLCAGAGMASSGPACRGLNGCVLSLPELPAVSLMTKARLANSRLPRPPVWLRCTRAQRRLADPRPFAAKPARFPQPRDLFLLAGEARPLADPCREKRLNPWETGPSPFHAHTAFPAFPRSIQSAPRRASNGGRERKRFFPCSQKTEAASGPSALGSVQ